jgi:hypothetical protein
MAWSIRDCDNQRDPVGQAAILWLAIVIYIGSPRRLAGCDDVRAGDAQYIR